MPRAVVRDYQQGFARGLNTSADPSQLGPKSLRRAENCRLSEAGAVKKILGQQRLHETALGAGDPIRGGFLWRRANGSTQLLVICGGTLYSGDYSVGMTWSDEGGAFSSGAIPSFAAFRDASGECVYIADGGALNKWDGTTLTENLAGTPSVTRLWVYNRRLMGVTGASELVYWSDVDDGDSLGVVANGGGSAGVRTFGSQRLTTGVTVGGSALMFHVAGISRFTGYSSDDIQVQAGTQGVSGTKGTIAPQSVVLVEDDENGLEAAFFLSNRGCFRASEGGIVPVLSDSLLSTLLSLDQSSWDRVQAAHNARYGEVLFYLPDVGVYAYNYIVGAWSGPWTATFTEAVTHALFEGEDDEGRPIVLMGGADGFVRRVDMPDVYKADVLHDGTGGEAITMIAQCHRMFFGDESVEKAYSYLYISADLKGTTGAGVSYQTVRNAETTQVTTATGGSSSDVWSDSDPGVWDQPGDNWGGDTVTAKTYAVPIDAQGEYLDVTLTDDSDAETLFSFVRAEGYLTNRRV